MVNSSCRVHSLGRRRILLVVVCYGVIIHLGQPQDFPQDEAYFGAYGNLEHQLMMLRDTVRMNAYQSAILGNPESFRGKVVLDVGCGTGILSVWAAQAGARRVFAVEAR